METDVNENEREAYRNRVERAMGEPGTAARLTRQLAAIEALVCGRPGSAATVQEPIFIASMRLTREELDLLVVTSGRDERDCVYLGFDIDDPEAEPAIAVLRPQGESVVTGAGSGSHRTRSGR